MAILNDILKANNEYEVDFLNAYIRVMNVIIDTMGEKVNIHIRVYPSQEARTKEKTGEDQIAVLMQAEEIDYEEIANVRNLHHVLGIDKKVITVPINDLAITLITAQTFFEKNTIFTRCYEWLHSNNYPTGTAI